MLSASVLRKKNCNEQICKAQATPRKPTLQIMACQHHSQMPRKHPGYIRISIKAVQKKNVCS